MKPTTQSPTGAPLAKADAVIVLVRTEEQSAATERAITEVARHLQIPLTGAWTRLDAREEGEAGIVRDGRRLHVRPATPVPDAAWTTFPEEVSRLPGVEAAFTWLFAEAQPGDVVEGTSEFAGGKLVVTREVHWSGDRDLGALTDGAARDAYVWQRYPLSELARRVGLEARPNWARWVENGIGRQRPDDVPNAVALPLYLPASMSKALGRAAKAKGASESKLVADLLTHLGRKRLTELAAGDRVVGDRTQVTLLLPEPVCEMLKETVVAVDSSYSHVVQRALLDAGLDK